VSKNDLVSKISKQALIARQAILHMTTLSGSGHPGGSMSSIDIMLSIYNTMRHNPDFPAWEERDKMVVSIGHISPAVYSTLGIMGYFPLEEAIAHFRQYGSIFEGHSEPDGPGVEWSSGNLGQGLSAATGFAVAARIKNLGSRVYVLMGDGEQQKGQLSEARRFASKYNLDNLIAVVDYNQLQISGSIHDVMPQNIRKNWEADGWQVLEVNGHDVSLILQTLEEAREAQKPVMILAHTTMGKGVSFMENKAKYHGSTLSPEQCAEALAELGMPNELSKYQAMRDSFRKTAHSSQIDFHPELKLKPGKPILHTDDGDCRGAWGKAIADLGKINENSENPIVVVDCDLAGSVKTADFRDALPSRFLQSGIMEHHAAVMSGAISTMGIQCFWADFGVFGIDEAYNMQRLNDINHSNLKTVLTHVGMDVGADGKTHQCIDYIAQARNLFETRIICPADANQTDRIVRWLIDKPGNYIVAMGRSKLPVIKDQDGEIFYNSDYCFDYGKADVLRIGDQGTVFVTGTLTARATKAVDALRDEGIFFKLVVISCPLEIPRDIVLEAAKMGPIFSVEDHSINGGLGSTLAEAIACNSIQAKLIRLGVEGYPVSGESDELFRAFDLDAASLKKRFKAALQ
jgi:transketolase